MLLTFTDEYKHLCWCGPTVVLKEDTSRGVWNFPLYQRQMHLIEHMLVSGGILFSFPIVTGLCKQCVGVSVGSKVYSSLVCYSAPTKDVSLALSCPLQEKELSDCRPVVT